MTCKECGTATYGLNPICYPCALKTKKKHKYNAKSSKVDGQHFPSQLEASVYSLLKVDPEVTKLETQPTVYLTTEQIPYKPDFKFFRSGELRYGEAKGKEGDRFRLIKKLWRGYGPAPLEIYKGTSRRPVLVKTIYPRGTE